MKKRRNDLPGLELIKWHKDRYPKDVYPCSLPSCNNNAHFLFLFSSSDGSFEVLFCYNHGKEVMRHKTIMHQISKKSRETKH